MWWGHKDDGKLVAHAGALVQPSYFKLLATHALGCRHKQSSVTAHQDEYSVRRNVTCSPASVDIRHLFILECGTRFGRSQLCYHPGVADCRRKISSRILTNGNTKTTLGC
jgi:hypothetical protein